MRSLAFYGKGGIGKTTVVSTLSALFAGRGAKILHIGCDPKHDSCYKLVERGQVRTVLSLVQNKGHDAIRAEDILMRGRSGVECIETGGPEPGVGCAGRGITLTFEILEKLGIFSAPYEVIMYDVLGDVVCGGFAAPMRKGYAKEIYVVLSGEVMALYAANNICRAIVANQRNGVRLGGFVANLRGVSNEVEALHRFAERLGGRLLHPIPQHQTVQLAEQAMQTVVEFAPESEIAGHYRTLFGEIEKISLSDCTLPTPLDENAFDQFVLEIANLRLSGAPDKNRPYESKENSRV